VPPVVAGPGEESYNVNADAVAGALVVATLVKRLVLMTNVLGVLDREGRLQSRLTASQARAFIDDGTISVGMILKIQTVIDAVLAGVRGVIILDAQIPNSLLKQLYMSESATTLIIPEFDDQICYCQCCP
jgi:acetylglutamate kinase